MPKRNAQSAEAPPWRMLLWATLAALIFGLISFGEIAEDDLRVARNALHPHRASGQIVLVQIDDRALQLVGNWPWPRSKQAELSERLTQAGVKRQFFDIILSTPSNPNDDRRLADAFKRAGSVHLAATSRFGPATSVAVQDEVPLPIFARVAKLASISVVYNFQNAVWHIPLASSVRGQTVPTISAALGDRRGKPNETFTPDYSLDLASVPTVSAADLLAGKIDPARLRGKDAVIGMTFGASDDRFYLPGTGKIAGVFLHVIGGETLKRGVPVDLGWVPGLLLAIAGGAVAVTRRRLRYRAASLAATAALLLAVPLLAEINLVFLDVTPGLFFTLVVTGVLLWRRYRQRGFVNPVSNLPNLNALRANAEGRKQAIVAARVLNYEEILAALPPNSEGQLVEQIASRLKVGDAERILYQGDGGIFAWFEPSQQTFGNHLDALHALFRNPARIAGGPIDLAIAFGVEVGSGRSLANRLASARVAADEAAHDGLKWKYHDPETLQDASWKLSMLSQLDAAIDRGEVWVAFQPKLDLKSRRIIGAEALARWTHPEKGPIAATEFVAAAETHDRIGKLTDFVLEKAVLAAAAINRSGTDFDVAVNLSARLLVDKGFTLRLSALLARHGLAPGHLTLELTETAALTGNGEGLDMITRLRDFGVRIAIDDYGTGLSTLDYLKKIPANELKIDQSFVKGMADNRSDRLMVQSTIGLAHSLDRQVVAEGVEQQNILDLLVEMGCDIAQGFAIGRR